MSYICKIATLEEMEEKWNYEIEHAKDKYNWKIWKESAIERVKNGKSIAYYGILDGKIISEATASLDRNIVQNSEGLISENTVYLNAFRTIEEYQGKGYFTKLFEYMLSDLKARGYKKVTLGVEPSEIKNIQIYFHYGFDEYVKSATEKYPDGEEILVNYYAKTL